jgi:hypothetical protein
VLSTIEQRHAARELQDKVASDNRAALDRAVADELASGAKLVSQGATDALLINGKITLTALHLVLSVLTAGLWLIVWAFLVANNKPKRIVLSVNGQGQVERNVTSATGSAAAP